MLANAANPSIARFFAVSEVSLYTALARQQGIA